MLSVYDQPYFNCMVWYHYCTGVATSSMGYYQVYQLLQCFIVYRLSSEMLMKQMKQSASTAARHKNKFRMIKIFVDYLKVVAVYPNVLVQYSAARNPSSILLFRNKMVDKWLASLDSVL